MSKISVPVRKGTGHTIGNALRSYASRSLGSWQPIGYQLPATAEGFGFSSNSMESIFNLFKGHIVDDQDNLGGNYPSGLSLMQFTWNGNTYIAPPFKLEGLSGGFGPTLNVYVDYGVGSRTEQQNMQSLTKVVGDRISGFFVVPSAHSQMRSFKYNISPRNAEEDWLEIDADPTLVDNARKAIISDLSALDLY